MTNVLVFYGLLLFRFKINYTHLTLKDKDSNMFDKLKGMIVMTISILCILILFSSAVQIVYHFNK